MPGQPNVLFVMTDQQRFDTIRALGHDHLHTPNLDRLAERGVACTNAYSPAPICVPARHAVRTGSHPLRTGYIGNDKRDARHLEETCGPFLARAMRERGYETWGVGKFHVHPGDVDLGYDRRWTPRDYASEVDADTDLDGGRAAAMNMLPQSCALDPEDRKMAWIADHAVDEIERGEGPFFGFASFGKPHPRFNPSQPFDQLYDPDAVPDAVREDRAVDHVDEKIPAQNYHFWKSREEDTSDVTVRVARAHYYGLITQLDRELGRILDAVEARDDAEDTVIVFTSDHGELLGDHHGWGKTSFFEASSRVPFLVSWPGELPAGERYDGLVSLLDIFGVATGAADEMDTRDGIDLLGAVRGESEGRERLFSVHETPRKTDAFAIGPNFSLMVREGDWKYCFFENGGREQLFDVASDPHETADRSEAESGITARLHDAAVDHVREFAPGRVEGDRLRARPFRELDMGRYFGDAYPSDPGDA